MSSSSKPFGSFPMRKSKSLSDLLGGQGGLHLPPNAIVAGSPEDNNSTTSPITSLETSMAQSLKISQDSQDDQEPSPSPPPSASSSSPILDSDDPPTSDAASPPPSAAPPHPPPTPSLISSSNPTAIALPQVTPPRQYVPNTPGLKAMPVPKGPAPKFTPPAKSAQVPSKDTKPPPVRSSSVPSSSSKQPAQPSASVSGLKSANEPENTKSTASHSTAPPSSSFKQPAQPSESSSVPQSDATEPETKDAKSTFSPPVSTQSKQTAQLPESSSAPKSDANEPETKGKTAKKVEKETKVDTEKNVRKSGKKVKSKKGKKGSETINSSDASKAPSSLPKPVVDQVPESAPPLGDALLARQCEEISEEDHNFTDLPPLPSSPSIASEDETPLDPSKDPGPTTTDSTPTPSAKEPPHHSPSSKKQESSLGPFPSNNDVKASSSNAPPVTSQSQARPPPTATPLAKKATVSPPTPQTPSHHLFGPFAYHRPPPAPPTPPGSILRPALNTNWSAWRDSAAIPLLTGVASSSTSSSRPNVSSTQTPKPPVVPSSKSSHVTVNPMWGPSVAPSATSSTDKGKGKAKEPDGPSTTASAFASVPTPALSQSNPAPQFPPQNTAPFGSSAPASTPSSSLSQPSTQAPSSNPPPTGGSDSQDDAMSWTPSNNAPSGSSQPPPPMQTQSSLNPAFLDIEMGGPDAGQPRLTSQQPQPGLFSWIFTSQAQQNPPMSTSLPSQQQTVAQPPSSGFFSSFAQAPTPTQQATSHQMPAGGFFSSFIQQQQQQPVIQQHQQPPAAQNPRPQPSSAPMSSMFSGFAQSLADGFASLKGQASGPGQGHGNAFSHIPGPSSSTGPTHPVYFQREGCRPHPILFALCQISPEACAKMKFPGQELLQPGLPPTVYPRDLEEFYQRSLSWLHTLNLPPCPYTVSFPSSESESESVSGDAPEWFLHLCQEFAPFDRDVGNIWVFACWAGIESKRYSVEHLRRVRSASVVNPARFEGHIQERIVKRAKTWREGCSTLYLAKHCSISKLKDVPRRFRVRRKPYSV